MKASVDSSGRLGSFYWLAKPGIIYGNLLTATAGFFFGACGELSISAFLGLLIGVSAVIGGSCVVNNIIDIDIDRKMLRTRHRLLVSGNVSVFEAWVFGLGLLAIGFFALWLWTNEITMLVGLVGAVDYILLYSYFKRTTVHGTLIGSISGATPPVAGYTAAAGHLNLAAGVLFLVLVFWQMAHFYAIAMYRIKDYRAAKLPMLPVIYGFRKTIIAIRTHIVLFISLSGLLWLLGYATLVYFAPVGVVGLWWLYESLQHTSDKLAGTWAKRQFRISLLVLLIFSLSLTIDSLIN